MASGLVGWRITNYKQQTARQQANTLVKPPKMLHVYCGPIRVSGDGVLDRQVFISVRVDHGKVDEANVLVDDDGMTFSA